MFFVRNLEDDKLEIHFSKSEYMAMDNEKKQFFKSRCLFSGQRQCWRSRGKLDSSWHIVKQLTEWGFEDKGSEGERLSFADQVEREQDKALHRAERSAHHQEKNEKASDATFNHAFDMIKVIPPGQPILVGHHSERGHRRLLEKHDNTMRKAFDLKDKAEYYANKYENAKDTAEGVKFNNAGYLINRIKECEANIRTYERRLQGKMYHYDNPKEISEKERVHWQEKKDYEQDKLDYMRYCLNQIAESDKGVFTKESLQGKTHVKIKGRWHELVRLNPKSVSVMNTCFPLPEHQKKYALKYNYGEVTEARTIEEAK